MSDLSEAIKFLEGETFHSFWADEIQTVLSAARSWQALVERVEARGRIIVEMPCVHGYRAAHCPIHGDPSVCDHATICGGESRVDVTEEVRG